jgi:hypothetical protein
VCNETERAVVYHYTRFRKDGSVVNSARGTEGKVAEGLSPEPRKSSSRVG